MICHNPLTQFYHGLPWSHHPRYTTLCLPLPGTFSLQVKEWILWWHPEELRFGLLSDRIDSISSYFDPGSDAETGCEIDTDVYHNVTFDSRSRVLNFDRREFVVHIRTRYKITIDPEIKSSYGRGTTGETDKQVTPPWGFMNPSTGWCASIISTETRFLTWWSGEGCLKGYCRNCRWFLGCVLTDMWVRWKLTTSMPWIVQAGQLRFAGRINTRRKLNFFFVLRKDSTNFHDRITGVSM